MKLYQWGRAPNPRRVRIYLAEKNLDVPMEDVGDGPTLAADYYKSYAMSTVPMLELDDGTQIGEAMAICRYFESEYPTPPLFGSSSRERGLVEMWERRAYDLALTGVAEVLRNTNPAFKDRGLPVYGDVVPQIPELAARGKWRFVKFLELLDEQLASNEFVAGANFSVADITTLCAIDFAKVIKERIPDDKKNVQRWHESVSARPSASA